MRRAVSVEDLVITYDDVDAVRGISFEVGAGEVVALLGPNGAGKTSTIETLEGYRRPDGGRVRVLDLDPVTQHEHLAPRIGVMLQDGGVYPGIRPTEMLRLLASLYDDPIDPDTLLDLVGLAERARATWRQLSGGEQQRLSLAMALIGRPEVAFLDEPTAGVDVRGRQVIRQVIRDLADDGAAVLVSTHELDEAERIADRVVIIDRGVVVAEGAVSELRADASRIRFSAPPGIDVLGLSNHLGVAVVQDAPGEYQFLSNGDPKLVARLTSWLADRDLALGDLRAGRQKLEDIFLALTGVDDDAEAGDDVSPAGRGRRRSRR